MKKFINRIIDTPKLIRTIWIILWIVLILLLVMKFCFNIWYPISVKNKIFNDICNFVDNNKIVRYSILIPLYVLNGDLIVLTCLRLKRYTKFYYFILVTVLNIGIFFLKFINNNLGLGCEILTIIVLIIINFKRNTYNKKIFNALIPIIYYIIINLWQFTIYFVRSLNIELLSNLSTLVLLILQFDYYIFLIITWLEVCFMGLAGWGWLWTRDITVLKAEKAKELSKPEPNEKLIAEIDKRITELEKEGR